MSGNVKLSCPAGGSVTISAADTASNLTVTVPAATSTLAIDGPAFSAYQSSAQTLATTTYTKLQFQTEEFDTNNCFDNVTNYRFTPNVAGYYQFIAGFEVGAATVGCILKFYKNGSAIKNAGNSNPSSLTSIYGSSLIYLNGSTDYVEAYGWVAVGQALAASAASTYFQGFLARSA